MPRFPDKDTFIAFVMIGAENEAAAVNIFIGVDENGAQIRVKITAVVEE